MSKFRSISHVIFDMDGVLLDTEPLYTRAINNVIQIYGKSLTWDIKAVMMGLQRVEASKFIVAELDLPLTWQEYDVAIQEQYQTVVIDPPIFPDTEIFYKRAIATIAKRFGRVYTHEIAAKVVGRIEQESARVAVEEMKLPLKVEEFQLEFRTKSHEFFRKHGVPLMPGAKVLVHHLTKHNIPISVATSSSQDSYELKSVHHKEFFKLFDHVVCGASDPDVKNGKPAPDIFLVSASRFPKKPQPSDCLVFEDAPNGIEAALKAGMQAVMVPDENIPEHLKKGATLVVGSLDETPLELFGLPPIESN